MSALLQTNGLSVAYDGIDAVSNVSLAVPAGQIAAIVGANGAGKTSIVKAIMGLHRQIQGEICYQGQPIQRLPVHARIAMGLALVPEARHLFPLMTVEENLDLGAYAARRRTQPQAGKERVYTLFPRLRERRRQLAGSLSGGEQQMLALGRALMAEPRLLILDEPSLGLAPVMVQTLFGLIRQLNAAGTTVLLVEQNTYQTLKIAHVAYVLEAGRLVHQGSGAALLHDPYVRQSYLGEM